MNKPVMHKALAAGRWFTFSLIEQLTHIGSDVERAVVWKNKDEPIYSQQALFRALELLQLTIADVKNTKGRKKELLRTYEILCDYFLGDNCYASTDSIVQKYFDEFAYAHALARQSRK